MQRRWERRRERRRKGLGRRANDVIYSRVAREGRNHLVFCVVLMLVLVTVEFFAHEGVVKWVDKGVDALCAAWVARVLFGE